MKGLLRLDPSKRLTAVEALALPWFDDLRDEEVEQLIRADRILKEEQQLARDYNGNSG